MNYKRIFVLFMGCIIVSIGISLFIGSRLKNVRFEDIDLHKVDVLISRDDHVMSKDTVDTRMNLYNNELDTFEALYQEADEVLMVQMTSRMQRQHTFISTVQIQESYKGNRTKDEEINILEPCYFETFEIYSGIEQYVSLVEGESYIVFLKDSTYNEVGYNYVSNIYGKLPLHKPIGFHYDESTHLTLEEFLKYDYAHQNYNEEDRIYVQNNIDECVEDCKRTKASMKSLLLYEKYSEKLLQLWKDCMDALNISI